MITPDSHECIQLRIEELEMFTVLAVFLRFSSDIGI